MIIEGTLIKGYAEVSVDGKFLDPKPSQKVWNHSPDGFNWGYGGSGPAQLALAILLAAGIRSERAVTLHQAFKWAFIATLPREESFSIDVDIQKWIERETCPRP